MRLGLLLSEQQRERLDYAFFRRLLDLRADEGLDETYVERLLAQLAGSPVRQVLLFAQDGRYDREGRLDRAATHCYVPNDWVFSVCKRRPALLPCASINPKRRDALAEAERCKALGARAVKVHPPTQDLDPADAAFAPFWRRLAELGLVLVVHTGGENASHVTDLDVADAARLEGALQAGCTVVAAHAGFGSFLDGIDFFPSLSGSCAATTACSATRRCSRRCSAGATCRGCSPTRRCSRARSTAATGRSRATRRCCRHLPPGTLSRLVGEANLFTRDLLLKQALGVPAPCFARGQAVFGA